MGRVFEMTDEEYRVIEEAAKERGQTPDDLFRAWVKTVRQYIQSDGPDPTQPCFWTTEWQTSGQAATDASVLTGALTEFDQASVNQGHLTIMATPTTRCGGNTSNASIRRPHLAGARRDGTRRA